jgi:glucosylglycerate phosphorylase
MLDRSGLIFAHLQALYGADQGELAYRRLLARMEHYRLPLGSLSARPLTERDTILITYADQLRDAAIPPLQTLADFCERHLADLVSAIHILPFYPSSSDDGFSVIDYRAVDPALGSWQDVERLGSSFRLMFDAVINHASAGSAWFKAFLLDEPPYRDFFVTVEGNPDLSAVVRPRALPLLTRFDGAGRPRQVWTTFSADQVDLNYKSPELLLEILDTLLFYVSQGAEFIRLDAIAYLWKEIGTSCIHLPQTHRIIQLFRAVLDELAPGVKLITETNVPHADNISYFGDGRNEAQLVYNFALPPLVLHSLQTGSARTLSAWAAGLPAQVPQAQVSLPSGRVSFFNFLASHDGVGLNPVRGILTEGEINDLVERVRLRGGLVSYKQDPDGSQSPYELNVNYFDALSDPADPHPDLQVERFLAAHAILLSLVGLPGLYFHSLFGSRGWPKGVPLTGINRTINRQKFQADEFERELADPASRRAQIFARLSRLLRARASHPAFDPYGSQQVLDWGEGIFALLRGGPETGRVLCLQNVTVERQHLSTNFRAAFGDSKATMRDLIGGQTLEVGQSALTLEPYQTLWLAAD